MIILNKPNKNKMRISVNLKIKENIKYRFKSI